VGAAGRAPALRRRLWIDDATLQFGVVTGLGYLDAPSTAVWLATELGEATADHRRGPLAQALSMVGAGEQARALADLASSASAGRAVRVRALHGIARVLNGRRPSWASVLCAHQDYLNPNTVVWHLSVFP
jgi:hypothetical protein